MALGRSKDYQPIQPIYYSHKVHAGINQINCQYCHIGVYQGKQANIPSVNICMNCHMAIKEYTGEKIFNEEGEEVNGTAEIQKLYKYAGYEEGKPWDASKAKPIEWARIHNLPDHVYFNHSQHVKAGKVAVPDLSWRDPENGRGKTVCRPEHGLVYQLPPRNQSAVQRQRILQHLRKIPPGPEKRKDR
jgi:hypothetical protein